MRPRSVRVRTRRNFQLASPERLEDRRQLSTFTVVNTDDGGPGSLRQAILDADVAGDGGTIAFDIPGGGVQTISPMSDLPPISASITIDGTTQPGARAGTNPVGQADNAVLLIQLSGASNPNDSILSITGGGATVRGLVLNGCFGGIGPGTAVDVAADGVTIAGDFIGTDPTGETRVINDFGIKIEAGTSGLTIGGTAPADRNVLAGSLYDIYSDLNASGISDLAILGNNIGVGADGVTIPFESGQSDPAGVKLQAPGTGLTIGGTAAGARNVFDVDLQVYDQSQVVIQGNFFSTDASGTARITSDNHGVGIYGCQGVTIGGPAPGAGNVFACPLGVGESRALSTGVVVQGNFIGTDASGTIPLGIGVDLNTTPVYAGALSLDFSAGALVGGTGHGEGNTIAFVQGVAMFIDTRGLPQGDLILGNSVYSNTGRGLFYPDAAANTHIDDSVLPQLTSATATAITGTFQTGANRTIRVEFFASPVELTGSPYAANQDRQGKTFLGAMDVTADGSGIAAFTFTPTTPIVGDQYITSTASSTTSGSAMTLGYSRGLLVSGPAANADVSVSVSDSPDPVDAGGLLTYTISLANAGPDPSSGVTLTDAIPAGTTFVSFKAPDGWSPRTPAVGGTGTVSATASDPMPEGAGAVFTLVVRVDPAAVGGVSIADTASISGTTADPDSDNDTDNASAIVQGAAAPPAADLAVTQSASPGTATAGTDDVTFTVEVMNRGSDPASNVTLTETLPDGATFVSATGGVTPSGGTLTFAIGDLASGATRPFTIVVRPQSAGTLNATATVSAAEADPSMANNQAVASAVSVSPSTVGQPDPTGIPTPTPASNDSRLIGVQRYGIHTMPTTVVLTFSEPLEPAARQLRNYRITGRHGARISIRSAVYDPTAYTVTLHPSERLSIHHPYTLLISGTGSGDLGDGSSRPLIGQVTGRSGSDYTIRLTWRQLVLPSWYRPAKVAASRRDQTIAGSRATRQESR